MIGFGTGSPHGRPGLAAGKPSEMLTGCCECGGRCRRRGVDRPRSRRRRGSGPGQGHHEQRCPRPACSWTGMSPSCAADQLGDDGQADAAARWPRWGWCRARTARRCAAAALGSMPTPVSVTVSVARSPSAAGAHGDRAARRGELRRVPEQVRDHLVHPAAVGPDRRRLQAALEGDLAGLEPPGQAVAPRLRPSAARSPGRRVSCRAAASAAASACRSSTILASRSTSSRSDAELRRGRLHDPVEQRLVARPAGRPPASAARAPRRRPGRDAAAPAGPARRPSGRRSRASSASSVGPRTLPTRAVRSPPPTALAASISRTTGRVMRRDMRDGHDQGEQRGQPRRPGDGPPELRSRSRWSARPRPGPRSGPSPCPARCLPDQDRRPVSRPVLAREARRRDHHLSADGRSPGPRAPILAARSMVDMRSARRPGAGRPREAATTTAMAWVSRVRWAWASWSTSAAARTAVSAAEQRDGGQRDGDERQRQPHPERGGIARPSHPG